MIILFGYFFCNAFHFLREVPDVPALACWVSLICSIKTPPRECSREGVGASVVCQARSYEAIIPVLAATSPVQQTAAQTQS